MSNEIKWILKMWNPVKKKTIQFRRERDAKSRMEREWKEGKWSGIGIEYDGEMLYERSRPV